MPYQGLLSRAEVRAVDRRAIEEVGMNGLVLMENAGRGAADLLVALGIHGPVVICCGKGNNGGDGLVIARHLLNLHHQVQIWVFARPDEMTPDAASNYRILQPTQGPIRLAAINPDMNELTKQFARADWIVDALFGTGLTGSVRAPFERIIAAINASGARVLAVDIPSGLDADSGQPLGPTVKAHHTVTFVAAKLGFAKAVAREWVGRVHVVDIGVPKVF